MALIARLTRSSMIETLGEDYIRTARAKGLSERAVVLRHGLRNSLIPIITIVGLSFGGLLGGGDHPRSAFSICPAWAPSSFGPSPRAITR